MSKTESFTASDGTVITYTPATVVPAPPVPPTPVATSWVYHLGVFKWPGDFSYSVSQNYNDTTGVPPAGVADLQIIQRGQGGSWQPYFTGYAFDLKPFTKLTFMVKPMAASSVFQVYFEATGDFPIGKSVDNIAPFCTPPLQIGKWSTCTIPLSAFDSTTKVTGASIMKFDVRDNGPVATTFYLAEVGFQ